jgi:prepilin-type processing-associated H-X9-DG protein
MDLNGNRVTCPLSAGQDGQPSDKELFFMTGLFFLENWKGSGGTVRHHTNNDVYDGLSQTIMFSENVRAGADPLDDDANWASPVALRNSFFVSFAVCENSTCAPGNVDYRLANSGQGAVNSSLTSAEGNAPWPSSFHSGGVNFAFADGHLRFISQYIDGGVYAALVSPQGARITGPLRQKIASDQDY